MSGIGRTFADLELRNARAMAAGQARWDNMAPPEPDETEFTEQEAREQAADELAANPASIMFHLGHLVGDDAQTASDHALYSDEWVPDTCTAGTLLAVLFEGSRANRDIARVELRDRLATRMQRDIAERAAELLAERNAEIARFQEAA